MYRIVVPDILTLHEATGNALAMSIEKQNIEKLVLNETIEMLENALNLGPLLLTPITIQTQQSTIPTTIISHGSIGSL